MEVLTLFFNIWHWILWCFGNSGILPYQNFWSISNIAISVVSEFLTLEFLSYHNVWCIGNSSIGIFSISEFLLHSNFGNSNIGVRKFHHIRILEIPIHVQTIYTIIPISCQISTLRLNFAAILCWGSDAVISLVSNINPRWLKIWVGSKWHLLSQNEAHPVSSNCGTMPFFLCMRVWAS